MGVHTHVNMGSNTHRRRIRSRSYSVHPMRNLPSSQNVNIVVQSAGKEIFLYDLINSKAYCLNETSSIVFHACDGKTSFEDLIQKYDFSEEIIYLALDELQNRGLIEGQPVTFFRNLSRREVIRKVGLSTLVALPLISSLVVPHAANANSVAACTPAGEICPYTNATQGPCCDGLRCREFNRC